MRLFISDNWRKALEEAGLASYEALMAYSGGHVFSKKSHSTTRSCDLPDGRRIFIKQDTRTKFQQVLRAIVKLRLPQTTTEKEHSHLVNAARLGFHVPEVVAASQHEWWTRPRGGVLVEAALPGVSLDKYAADSSIPLEMRRKAVAAAREVLLQIQDAKLDWRRDCKPEHFFVQEDGGIALLDVERLYPCRIPLSEKKCAAQLNVFHSLLPQEVK
ncbi:MAG: hypothetical protein IJS15_00485 [Victivallales bacterium]|nr:hypothetical protein [Victivallales bacterium]